MIVFILQSVAFFTLFERHFLGGSQCRMSPNKVGYSGVFQAFFWWFEIVKKGAWFVALFFLVFFYIYANLLFCFDDFLKFTLPHFYCFVFWHKKLLHNYTAKGISRFKIYQFIYKWSKSSQLLSSLGWLFCYHCYCYDNSNIILLFHCIPWNICKLRASYLKVH